MRKQWFLVCLFSLLLVSCVFGAYRYYDSSYGGGFLGFRGFTLSDIYNQYGIFIDAAIILLVFLSAAKISLKKKFGEEKVLYITIGIALSLAFLLWEEKSGFTLLGAGAGFIIYIVIAALVFLVAKFIMTAKRLELASGSLAYIVLYVIMSSSDYASSYIYDISYRINFDVSRIMTWLLVIAIAAFIIGTVFKESTIKRMISLED